MRNRPPLPLRLLSLLALLAGGCNLPGQPSPDDRPVPEEDVLDFDVLFRTHCAGCHGASGMYGPAPPLNDPIFLAIVPDEEVRHVITHGRPGTLMPAFGRAPSQQPGVRIKPPLTDKQIDVLASGLKEHWADPSGVPQGKLPPYPSRNGKSKGDAEAGSEVFMMACASCHGMDGTGKDENGKPSDAGPLNDPAFLSLISRQALERIVITGRRDFGMPNFATRAGRPKGFDPLTPEDIRNVTALLESWKQGTPAKRKGPRQGRQPR